MLTISRRPAAAACGTVMAWPGISPPASGRAERAWGPSWGHTATAGVPAAGMSAQSRRLSQVARIRAPRNQFVPGTGLYFSIPSSARIQLDSLSNEEILDRLSYRNKCV
jgi:hypothetical protein